MGTRSVARRKSSSRVSDDGTIPAGAASPGLTAPPCYAVIGSEGEPHRPGQKAHQRRLTPARGREAGREIRRAGLLLVEPDARREREPLEIVDEGMIRIEAARRALQDLLVE